MPHAIRRLAIGSSSYVDIDNASRDAIISASKVLVDCSDIEEIYDVFMSNYGDMLHSVSSIVIDSMIFSVRDHLELNYLRSRLNRAISNVFFSARSYHDHVDRILKNRSEFSKDARDKVKKARSDEYNSSPSYRISEAMRNFCQHRSMPVSGFSLGGGWEDDGALSWRRHDLMVYTATTDLIKDPECKRKIYADVENTEKVDLLDCIASYVDSISKIHIVVRNVTDEAVSNADNTMQEFINAWDNQFPNEGRVGLHLVEYQDNPAIFEPICSVYDGSIKFRKYLRNKNTGLNNLKRAYGATRRI